MQKCRTKPSADFSLRLRLSFFHFYLSSSGTPINKRPVLGYRNLNLFKLYRLVHKLGGFDNVSAASAAAPLHLVHFGHTFLVRW